MAFAWWSVIRALGAIGVLGGVLGSVGCSAKQGTGGKCTDDTQCLPSACMNGTCIPRTTSDRTVAVEILPRTDSTAARTSIASVAVGSGQIALAADDRVPIEATVTYAPDAHVVLMAVNPIPGQADLQFETELADSKFQITVGSRLIRSMASIWLNPSLEDQQKQSPVPFTTMLDSSLTFTYPPASSMTVLHAALHDSLDGAAVGYLARASVGNQVVSNVATTDDSGMFQLNIAPGAIPADGAQSVTIDFTPVDAKSGPRFQTGLVPLATVAANNAKPRVFRMPAFLKPAPLRFVVQSVDTAAPISDVAMRFRTTISGGEDGTAIYEQDGLTDIGGEVQVQLIPGSAADPRTYQISISPSPDSPYASRCIPDNPVTNVGNDDQPQYSSTFKLDSKVILRGTVQGSGASPAATVSVKATPIALNSACANPTAPSSVSATTLRTGYYEMLVDPGTYRLDIDPPMGSDVPRLTEDGDQAVVVSTDSVTNHDVTLPAGEVIEGDVKGMDSQPLGSANIKIFQVLCQADTCEGPSRIPPALRAQTSTNVLGHFRTVLPLP